MAQEMTTTPCRPHVQHTEVEGDFGGTAVDSMRAADHFGATLSEAVVEQRFSTINPSN